MQATGVTNKKLLYIYDTEHFFKRAVKYITDEEL